MFLTESRHYCRTLRQIPLVYLEWIWHDLVVRVDHQSEFMRFLQTELVERCRRNPKYSIRSFARFLRIDSSTLSQFLRGKRKMSPDLVSTLAKRLTLEPDRIAYFCNDHPMPTDAARRYFQLEANAFSAISDWHHDAILELVGVKGFQPDSRWIAKTLKIPVPVAQDAVDRLFNLGFLKKVNGAWINAAGNTTVINGDYRAAAFRKLQKQQLEKSIAALEETPLEKRDHSSMTLAIRRSRLPEAIDKITKFRRELSEFLESDETKNEVYLLNISLIPLTDLSSIKPKKGAKP